MKLSAIIIFLALVFVFGQAKKTEDVTRRLVESQNVMAKEQTQTGGVEAVRMCHKRCCVTHRFFGRTHRHCFPCMRPCGKVCKNVCTRRRVHRCRNIRVPYLCGWRGFRPRICHKNVRHCGHVWQNHCVRKCAVATANEAEVGDFESVDESAKNFYTTEDAETVKTVNLKVTEDLTRRLAESQNVVAKEQTQTGGVEAVRMCHKKCCVTHRFFGRTHRHCFPCMRPCGKVCKNVCTRRRVHRCRNIRVPYVCGWRGFRPRICYKNVRHCGHVWQNHCVRKCAVATTNEEAGDFESLDESAKNFYTSE